MKIALKSNIFILDFCNLMGHFLSIYIEQFSRVSK